MKVVKNIDEQEKSMRKIFDELSKHCEKYPEDFATMYIGRRMKEGKSDMMQSNSWIKNQNKEHFIESHIWQFYKLMEALTPDGVKNIYNHALEIYKLEQEL